ncbi:MAG: penicillin-binding protein 2 [Flavobacteriales bacterium]|jgi:penicillin-binding protein 2
MRKLLLLLIVLVTGLVFTGRLFYLQIYDTSFAKLSENNAVKTEYDFPQRGYIFDRNGTLLVQNQPSYDVMVVPREVKEIDTLAFCNLLKISKETLLEKLSAARHYSPRLASPIIPQLTKNEYASLSEKIHKYRGFFIQKRSLRDYEVSHSANVLGYIREVDQNIIDKNPAYEMGEIIGMTGVEKQYEEILRGTKGVKYIQKDRFNREIGQYKEGIFDTLPERGKDITLTIDAVLQAYGEKLFSNKRGGIVALEPKTGEILSLVTAPYFDPSLLVGRERSQNFTKLYYDTIAIPLFDRGLKAEYPPGSPFKTLTALIAMQENVVSLSERIECRGGYYYGKRGRKLGCHDHKSPLDLQGGIAKSCNTYFCTVYKRVIEKYNTPQEGIDNWRNHLLSFGLGNFLGYDLPVGSRGKIPSSNTYNAKYPNNNWYATATISNAIGQGEVLLTPIQMANFTAAIANRGWWVRPHIIKNVQDQDTIPSVFEIKNKTTIDPRYFEPIIEGMHDVYKDGTATFLQIPDIEICGKTGTAENFKKINGTVKQLTDHSVFIAFAPKEDPKIAIAVFVENGYWGARWAGRIASLMIEKYINGEITRTDMEAYVLDGSLEEEYAKPYTGRPFKINQ